MEAVMYQYETDGFIIAALEDSLINDVAVSVDGDKVIIALKTKAIFFKSDGDKLINRISLLAKVYFEGCDITVTRDIQTFYKIKTLN